jgi:hypothetical protein
MKVEIIYTIWSFRDSLSYTTFVMLRRHYRILMASYNRYENKFSCRVEAREIKRIRKDINKDRRYMADILQNKSKDWELNM